MTIEHTKQTVYITASSHAQRTLQDKEASNLNLTDMLAEQIISAIRKNLNNRLKDQNPLKISTVVIANQLYFDRLREASEVNQSLGIRGNEPIEDDKIQRIKLELDNTELFCAAKLNQIAWRVRQKILALTENNLSIPEETKESLRQAKFIVTRVKSNGQPAIQEACQYVTADEAVVFGGGEIMNGFKNPSYSLADTVIPDSLRSSEESNTMSKVIEGMIINLGRNLNIPDELLKKHLDYAAAYSRLMAFKNPQALNPQNKENEWFDPSDTDQNNFKKILAKIQDDRVMDNHKIFKKSHCCFNANGAGAIILEDQQTTKHALKIRGMVTERNIYSIADRYHGVNDGKTIKSDKTIQIAYNKLKESTDLTNDEAHKMAISIHNAFSILVALFLNPLGKIAGDNLADQMQNFINMCDKDVTQLEKLRICPLGGLFGGHPSSATAISMIDQFFGYYKQQNNAHQNLTLITSVWGPLEAISLMLLEYCQKTIANSAAANLAIEQEELDLVA
ncbi:MAG: hypothetical protein UR28_C0015G0015 [Candidatus Peregrinibacteria bacterium GW2011_GWF2_33_10]|nr:MAG: hypothetical protein UR28_C0015G0015 [Candidatus Peregrinibacteria bacterium GW2011_GWF2_33_10]OGJ44987.1 MAG: hypothetical protein A2263_02900 [Candidatus Peregrinibacteria bacterium RIFOXYA2_FULL_33_21]OGJ47461.1 MAG: hypothetical protein A2272_04315 [Candidatus Peregrinibacteria bacterium RIFOXYA12_FULL_33_12]OGJ50730.1 MAG: hypothetical protein A2307_03715 [Candidatus Peregrinibacteria bacterium RIFOXYB2_FULL_33_20]